MDDEIQLISDGDGVAILGDQAAVDRFLVSEGLTARDLGLQRLGAAALGKAGGVAQASAEIAANSGRWMKLTEESAKIANHLPKVKNSTTGNVHATLRAPSGQFAKNLQFVPGPGSLLNPALLAGAGGLMAQLAMQQAMDEITDYLAKIDAKVDDVLRAQKDAVLADMIGVHLVIEEAMTIREHTGRVSEVTWSKIQATPATIARTQAYALRQLDALAEKLERKAQIGDLAKAAKEAQSKTQDWLAVLARCVQLQDAIAVLELDRVLDAAPDELDRHRLALRVARQNRLDLISRSTEHLLDRMNAATGTANSKVLLHPTSSSAVVHSSGQVVVVVLDFQERLGIEDGHDSLAAKRWMVAAVEVRDKALETGSEGVDAAKRFSSGAFDRARSMTGKISSGVAERALRRRGGVEEGAVEAE